MNPLEIVQVNADQGVAPGGTKGAALHLRGVAAGLTACGHSVVTYSRRQPEGRFPVAVRPLDELPMVTRAAVVYERYSLAHRGGLDQARMLDVPFVLEVNAPLVEEATEHRPATVPPDGAEIERELLAEADLVISVSSGLTRWLEQARQGPIETIPNGFEPRWFPPSVGRSVAADRIVFLGHPKPWHGADNLAHLLVDLADLGHSPELLVIGGGAGAEALTERAGELGRRGQVVVTGPIAPSRVSAMLTTAAVGLAPYPMRDPFYFCPLKVIDYMAAGLPVVATGLGDIADIVGPGGVIVEPGDRLALAGAVGELLGDPLRAAAMGERGRRRAFATMTWQQVGRRTEAAIGGVLGASSEIAHLR